MKMQFGKVGKIVAAGTLAALMMGTTVSFAALDSYPAPFVTSSGVQSLIVVGSQSTDAAGLAADIAGAIDIAARLGGEVTTDVAVPGANIIGAVVGGEGRALETTTTHIFLQDNLGKNGLRTTLTKDDMPILLASGSFSAADGTHKYMQYIDLTPGTTNPANVRLDFDKPGSSSSADPTYNFGRFTTSPGTSEYMYRTRIVFDVGWDQGNATSKSMTVFGNDYTVSSDTSSTFAGTTADKVVLFGGANIVTLHGGESTTITLNGVDYEVKLNGVTSRNAAAVQVGSQTESIAKGTSSSNFGDLKIYVKDAAQLSTTDNTQNYATLLVGADKLTLQDGNKIKKGTNDDTLDGTFVDLIVSSGKVSEIDIYFSGTSSTNDHIDVGSSVYMNPVFKTFGIQFPTISPAVGGSGDDQITFRNSGDNDMQIKFTDQNSNTQTINFAHKNASSGATLILGDSSSNQIHVVENETVTRDEYIVLDAGGFPHMFKVNSVSLDGTSSSSIDLSDVVTGATTKITTGADNNETFTIDGQAYNFYNVSSTAFGVTWGNASALSAVNKATVGSFTTVFPTMKTAHGALVAFHRPNTRVYYGGLNNGSSVKIQLPTGAIQLTNWQIGNTAYLNVTAVGKEDGTASACSATPCILNFNNTNTGSNTTFTLGRTSSGGVVYNFLQDVANQSINISVMGTSTTVMPIQPGVLVWEEKDDAGNQAGVNVPLQTASNSAGNNLAGIGSFDFTASTTSGSQTWGSNSNKASSVDYWGTVGIRDTATSAQPIGDLWYPDIQRAANVYVLDQHATVSSGGSSGGGTVKQAVPIKTSIAKLDSEVTSADKSTKNLILVGGPAVNMLVADLAAAGKSWTRDQYIQQGEGTAIVNLVADAFTAGKSALVVAGHSAADTRFVSSILQQFDTHKADLMGKNLVVYKNGVISSSLSA